MRTALGFILISNAALFFLGAVQHAGISLGRIHEPRIIPAAIVEATCGLFLLWGGIAVFGNLSRHWMIALIGNLTALAGVLLGMGGTGSRQGPRTASNDLYHRIMLVLIAAGLLILFFARAVLQRN